MARKTKNNDSLPPPISSRHANRNKSKYKRSGKQPLQDSPNRDSSTPPRKRTRRRPKNSPDAPSPPVPNPQSLDPLPIQDAATAFAHELQPPVWDDTPLALPSAPYPPFPTLPSRTRSPITTIIPPPLNDAAEKPPVPPTKTMEDTVMKNGQSATATPMQNATTPLESTSTMVDKADPNINNHIAGLSNKQSRQSSDNITPSPVRKKDKKSSSILKSSLSKQHDTPPNIDYTYNRIILEASFILSESAEKDRYAEYTNSIGTIIKNAAYIDPHFVINPLSSATTLPVWKAAKDIPSNMTAFGRYIFSSSPAWRFKKKGAKPGDNTVYFSFTVSSTVDPVTICSAIHLEWGRQNGDRLGIKTVQCHDTTAPIMFFRLWSEGPTDGLLMELREILTQAWIYGRHKGDDFLPDTLSLPDMSFRKSIPQLKGSNAHAFTPNLPPHINNARKVVHLEVGKAHAALILHLVTIAKNTEIFDAWWGKTVHPTTVLDADAPKKDRDALESMAHDHTCYICAVRTERLIGIARLDKMVPFTTEQNGRKITKGNFSLRMILLDHLHTADGRRVIGSIHLRGSEEPYVVIPNEAEIESLILRLNHQLPAFLLHYLPTRGIPTEYVQTLLKASCDPTLYNDAQKCTWDATEWVITRPDEEALREKREQEERDSQWYKGFVNMHLVSEQPKGYVAPEARYDLDGEKSVNTIHQSRKKHESKARRQSRAQSAGDSDSTGAHHNSDSASKNANTKPYSTVGFGDETSLGDSSQSSSDEDSIISDDDSLSPSRKGDGG